MVNKEREMKLVANYSDCYGTIYINEDFVEKVTGDEENTKIFMKNFQEIVSYIINYVEIQSSNNEEMEFKFSGSGKWSFISSLEWLGENISKVFLKNKEKVSNEYEKNALLTIKPFIEKWQQNPKCYLSFCYTDYEPGCEILYEAETNVFFDNAETVSQSDLEYTVKNLINLGFEDENKISPEDINNNLLKEILIDEYPDFLKDKVLMKFFIEDAKNEFEEYFAIDKYEELLNYFKEWIENR